MLNASELVRVTSSVHMWYDVMHSHFETQLEIRLSQVGIEHNLGDPELQILMLTWESTPLYCKILQHEYRTELYSDIQQ